MNESPIIPQKLGDKEFVFGLSRNNGGIMVEYDEIESSSNALQVHFAKPWNMAPPPPPI